MKSKPTALSLGLLVLSGIASAQAGADPICGETSTIEKIAAFPAKADLRCLDSVSERNGVAYLYYEDRAGKRSLVLVRAKATKSGYARTAKTIYPLAKLPRFHSQDVLGGARIVPTTNVIVTLQGVQSIHVVDLKTQKELKGFIPKNAKDFRVKSMCNGCEVALEDDPRPGLLQEAITIVTAGKRHVEYRYEDLVETTKACTTKTMDEEGLARRRKMIEEWQAGYDAMIAKGISPDSKAAQLYVTTIAKLKKAVAEGETTTCSEVPASKTEKIYF